MYLTIDPTKAPAAAAFSNEILPKVKAATGFVAGYWVDPVDSDGFGFILFETEDQARAAIPLATKWLAPGMTILRTDVRRVAVAMP
ncbi:MAG: hypothetical protein ACRD4P_00900 [Bryobacteraceae bacterium]